MSSHDCSLRGSDLIIKRDIKQEDVIEALRVFADDAGPGFTPDSVTFEDGVLDFGIDFYGWGGGEGDDNVQALVQKLCQMIADKGALVLRDYDTGDFDQSRTILGIGRSVHDRHLAKLDFQLDELRDSLSDRLSPAVFDTQFAHPLRAAVSATFKQGEDSGREDGLDSSEGT